MTDTPTLEQIRRWPAVVDIPDAAAALGISRAQAYLVLKAGRFPVRVITVGRRYKAVTADLLRLLSAETPGSAP